MSAHIMARVRGPSLRGGVVHTSPHRYGANNRASAAHHLRSESRSPSRRLAVPYSARPSYDHSMTASPYTSRHRNHPPTSPISHLPSVAAIGAVAEGNAVGANPIEDQRLRDVHASKVDDPPGFPEVEAVGSRDARYLARHAGVCGNPLLQRDPEGPRGLSVNGEDRSVVLVGALTVGGDVCVRRIRIGVGARSLLHARSRGCRRHIPHGRRLDGRRWR